MKAEALKRRIKTLEAQRPDVDRSEIRTFLSKLTEEELRRLRDIRQQIEEEQREPTEEEKRFSRELVAKYGA